MTQKGNTLDDPKEEPMKECRKNDFLNFVDLMDLDYYCATLHHNRRAPGSGPAQLK